MSREAGGVGDDVETGDAADGEDVIDDGEVAGCIGYAYLSEFIMLGGTSSC